MQIKILILAFAAVLVTVSLATLHMANANSSPSAPVGPHSNQDAIKTTITDGLQLANQTYQQWQGKLQQHKQSDQQEKQLIANGHSNNKFDNRSPSVMAELPF
jgi:hypothetical protein